MLLDTVVGLVKHDQAEIFPVEPLLIQEVVCIRCERETVYMLKQFFQNLHSYKSVQQRKM